jgi:hypothetical protein
VREDPGILVDDPKRELRSFRLTTSALMGSKRGQGRGSFVGSVLGILDELYGSTVQTLKPWSAAPPKLREQPPPGIPEPHVPPQFISTSLSSQDGGDQIAATAPGEQPEPLV